MLNDIMISKIGIPTRCGTFGSVWESNRFHWPAHHSVMYDMLIENIACGTLTANDEAELSKTESRIESRNLRVQF